MDNTENIIDSGGNESSAKKPSQYSPLVLAYIGDAVYELYVRGRVIHEHENMPAHKLHMQTIKYVKAEAQSRSITHILETLGENEKAVFRRGRNAKAYTAAKNADILDYRRATGLEALIGYLYLAGATERLEEIMKSAYDTALIPIETA